MNPILLVGLSVAAAGVVALVTRRAGASPGLPTVRDASPEPGRDASPATPAPADTPIPVYAPGDPQSTCDPEPKPGTIAFRDHVLANYGGVDAGITRACDVAGLSAKSEHKEGRAWDWHVPDKEAGDRLVGDLLAEDIHGNKHAGARRWGIQYLIWYRRLWSASRAARGEGSPLGWTDYPHRGNATVEHRDHIHFSQSRKAAATEDLPL